MSSLDSFFDIVMIAMVAAIAAFFVGGIATGTVPKIPSLPLQWVHRDDDPGFFRFVLILNTVLGLIGLALFWLFFG